MKCDTHFGVNKSSLPHTTHTHQIPTTHRTPHIDTTTCLFPSLTAGRDPGLELDGGIEGRGVEVKVAGDVALLLLDRLLAATVVFLRVAVLFCCFWLGGWVGGGRWWVSGEWVGMPCGIVQWW
jgi:hypothetical protein